MSIKLKGEFITRPPNYDPNPVVTETPKVYVMPLTEEQISKLPFPDTARKIGGLLMLDTGALENHLNVEEFRRQWNEQVRGNK